MSWVGIMNICIPIAEMCRDSESVCEINYQIDWFKSATLVGSKRYDGDVSQKKYQSMREEVTGNARGG